MVSIYLRDPSLLELCSGFLSVIEESLERNDYGRALELGEEWLHLLDRDVAEVPGLDTSGLDDQKAAIRLWRAELFSELQRWDQASQEIDAVLCRRQRVEDGLLVSRSWILAAQLHGLYGEQNQATQALEHSLQLDPEGKFAAQRSLEQARLSLRAGDLEQALQCVPLHDQSGPECAIERGRILFRLHRLEEAKEAWFHVVESQVYQLQRLPQYTRFQAEALRLLGLLHRELADPTQALIYLERSLIAFSKLRLWIGVAKSYEGLGQVCSDLGRLTEALHFTHKAERLSRRLGAESELAVVYGRLGNLCMKLGDFSRAIRFHQLDVELCRRFGNFRALAYALFNLGLSYRSQGSHQLASELLTESLERFLQLSERGPILRVRIERGRTLIERNLLDEASEDLHAASLMLGAATSPADAALIHVLSARMERLRGRRDKARQYLFLATEVLDDVPKDAVVRAEVGREEGYLFLELGELDAAAQAFTSAINYARKGEQQAIWTECLEQLDRLDDLQASLMVLEGLHRSSRDSGELTEVNRLPSEAASS